MAIGSHRQQDPRKAERGTASDGSRRVDRVFVLGAAFISLLARFLTLPAMTRDGLRLATMDDYGHLRRAMATLVDFPRVPAFDPFLHHPEGAIWIWPPGFDFGIALFARLLFGAGAELAEVTLIAALLPPLLGALTCWPLFVFVRRSFGSFEARWTVAVYALVPAAVVWSSFGHADQHCAEAFCLALVLAAFSRVLGGESTGLRDRAGMICAAASLAAAVLIWQGAVFLAVVVAVAAVAARRPLPVALALLGAALLVLPLAWSYGGPISYLSFGRFQPIFLMLWAGLLALAAVPRWGLGAAIAAGAVAALAWPPISAGVLHLLSESSGSGLTGAGYDSSSKEWLELIFEYRPLFSSGLARPVGQLTVGLLVLPVAAVWWALEFRRRPDRRSRLALPLVAAVTISLMTLSQGRYVYYLALVVAIAVASLLAALARWAPAGRWIAALVALLCVAPVVPTLARQTRVEAAAGEDVFWTLETLAALDPPEVEPYRPALVQAGEVPGVLAPWSLGHLVTLYAGRPAVSDNFGYGFDRQAWVYSAPPDADREVAERLRRWNCRYLITAELDPVIGAYAAAADREFDSPDRMLVNRVHRSAELQPLDFLELVLVSRTGRVAEDGSFLPRLKVFRIHGGGPATAEPTSQDG